MLMARTCIEPTLRKRVRMRGDERLIEGFTAAQSIAADLLLIEIDLAAHEPMRPEGINFQHLAQHFHGSCFARSAQVDDASCWAGLPIGLEVMGEGRAWRQMVMPLR